MENQTMNDLAKRIREKALGLGYENCGIIPAEAVADYAEKLDERIARVPAGEMQFGKFRGLSSPQEQFPWVNSIVVLVHRYSVYSVPAELEGVYAKAYLFDDRLDENSDAYKRRQQFGEFLDEIGIRHVTESKFGLTALRWAAVKAGLGTIRHNNFFYTPNGSYLMLEAFLIDKRAEWIMEMNYEEIGETLGKKFWYIEPENLWKWKRLVCWRRWVKWRSIAASRSVRRTSRSRPNSPANRSM